MKKKQIALMLFAIFFLVVSYTYYYNTVWLDLDLGIFKLLNGMLENFPILNLFWAVMNNKNMDWVTDVIFVSLFLWHIFSTEDKKERLRRFFQMCFTAGVLFSVIFFVNRGLLHKMIVIYRDSPSVVFPEAIKLSKLVPSVSFKELSTKSFPADHATTAILFTFLFCYFSEGTKRITASIYAILLVLPRLITGAHWCSDVLVGSGVICLSAFLFISPFLSQKWLKPRI